MYTTSYNNIYAKQELSFPRWITSFPFAAVMTFLLLIAMVKLVLVDYEEPEESEPFSPVEISFVEKKLETHDSFERPTPPEIQEVPEKPDPTELDPNNKQIEIPPFDGHKQVTRSSSINFEGMPIAQVRAMAKYPNAAIRRGIEGYVDVRFDISKIGTTKNIEAIGAEPVGVFEKSAVAAVKKWRYQPQTKNGEPVPYLGMVQRIRFQMQK